MLGCRSARLLVALAFVLWAVHGAPAPRGGEYGSTEDRERVHLRLQDRRHAGALIAAGEEEGVEHGNEDVAVDSTHHRARQASVRRASKGHGLKKTRRSVSRREDGDGSSPYAMYDERQESASDTVDQEGRYHEPTGSTLTAAAPEVAEADSLDRTSDLTADHGVPDSHNGVDEHASEGYEAVRDPGTTASGSYVSAGAAHSSAVSSYVSAGAANEAVGAYTESDDTASVSGSYAGADVAVDNSAYDSVTSDEYEYEASSDNGEAPIAADQTAVMDGTVPIPSADAAYIPSDVADAGAEGSYTAGDTVGNEVAYSPDEVAPVTASSLHRSENAVSTSSNGSQVYHRTVPDIDGYVHEEDMTAAAVEDPYAAQGTTSVSVEDPYAAQGTTSVAVEDPYAAQGTTSVAVEDPYAAQGTTSVAVEDPYAAQGTTSVAVEDPYAAQGTTSVAVEDPYAAQGTTSVAVEDPYAAEGTTSAAIGSSYGAEGTTSAAIGSSYTTEGTTSAAIGSSYTTEGTTSAAVGSSYGAESTTSAAIGSSYGTESTTTGAIGRSYGAEGTTTGAIGSSFGAEGTTTGAIGSSYGAEGTTTGAIGSSYGAEGTTSTAIDSSYGAEGTTSTAIGSSYGAEGTTSAAIDRSYGAEGTTSAAIGSSYGAEGTVSAAIGSSHGAEGTTTGAIDSSYGAEGTTSATIGSSYGAEGTTSAAIGSSYGSEGTTSAAIGSLYTTEDTRSATIGSSYTTEEASYAPVTGVQSDGYDRRAEQRPAVGEEITTATDFGSVGYGSGARGSRHPDAAAGHDGYEVVAVHLDGDEDEGATSSSSEAVDGTERSNPYESGSTYESGNAEEDDLRVDGIMSNDIAVDSSSTGGEELDLSEPLDSLAPDVPMLSNVKPSEEVGRLSVTGLGFRETTTLVCRHAARNEVTLARTSIAEYVSSEFVLCELPTDLRDYPEEFEFDLEVSNDGKQFSQPLMYSRAMIESSFPPLFRRAGRGAEPLMSGSPDAARSVGIARWRNHILFMLVLSGTGALMVRSFGFFRSRPTIPRGKLAGSIIR